MTCVGGLEVIIGGRFCGGSGLSGELGFQESFAHEERSIEEINPAVIVLLAIALKFFNMFSKLILKAIKENYLRFVLVKIIVLFLF